jgi:hypothetical protein
MLTTTSLAGCFFQCFIEGWYKGRVDDSRRERKFSYDLLQTLGDW